MLCKQAAPDVQLMPVDVNRRYIRGVNVLRIFRVIAYLSIGSLAPTFREKWLSDVFSEANEHFFPKRRQKSVKRREDELKRGKENQGPQPLLVRYLVYTGPMFQASFGKEVTLLCWLFTRPSCGSACKSRR